MGPLTRALLKVVLDTSIVVRVYINPYGPAARILRYWEEGQYDLIVSDAILTEYRETLNYPRIQRRHRLDAVAIARTIRLIYDRATVVEPTETIDAIKNDESDNRFLECAVAGGAAYIVSADNHLLTLGVYRDIQIVTPADFLAAMGERR